MTTEEVYMKRCLALAEKGKGHAAPNPMVGALLVYGDRVIGEGWHRQYGQAHAEVNCFDSVKAEDRALVPQSTMYVSLEPCAHYGKTPPCAERIVKEGVKKVVVCNVDPFEKVGGKGIEILKAASIEVQTGVLENEGNWLNRRFFTFNIRQRPYIILKWAQTVDGHFAPLNRTRFQLSNEHSKQLLHKWRTEERAIMIGYNTALNDDPQLTARLWEGPQPLRIVIDEHLTLPHSLRVFNGEADTWILNARDDSATGNLRFIKLDFRTSILPQLMKRLHDAKILSLIVEGGVQLLDSFIAAGLWDEARIFTANVSMPEGIAAPALTDAGSVLEMDIDTDTLSLFLNKDNPYRYVNGMEL